MSGIKPLSSRAPLQLEEVLDASAGIPGLDNVPPPYGEGSPAPPDAGTLSGHLTATDWPEPFLALYLMAGPL